MRYIITGLALVMLAGCTQYQRGVEFTRARIETYCATVPPLERDALRRQLVHDDGSPMIEVHCEPHGEPVAP